MVILARGEEAEKPVPIPLKESVMIEIERWGRCHSCFRSKLLMIDAVSEGESLGSRVTQILGEPLDGQRYQYS